MSSPWKSRQQNHAAGKLPFEQNLSGLVGLAVTVLMRSAVPLVGAQNVLVNLWCRVCAASSGPILHMARIYMHMYL